MSTDFIKIYSIVLTTLIDFLLGVTLFVCEFSCHLPILKLSRQNICFLLCSNSLVPLEVSIFFIFAQLTWDNYYGI